MMQRLSHCTKDSTLVYLDSPDSAFLLDAEIIPQTWNKASSFQRGSIVIAVKSAVSRKEKGKIRFVKKFYFYLSVSFFPIARYMCVQKAEMQSFSTYEIYAFFSFSCIRLIRFEEVRLCFAVSDWS